jgi:hypothetical protein
MSKGVLVIARNNNNIDYVKQAVFLAKRVKKYLNLPTSIITDNVAYLEKAFDKNIFDKIIKVDYEHKSNSRNFYDGGLASKTDTFKNSSSGTRNQKEFEFISDSGCEFYWATCVFFRKTDDNKLFFDLIKHIQEEWNHYRRVYQIQSNLFRNDFAFSIALHILNGFNKGSFCGEMPGKLLYITDQDILWNMNDENMLFLVAKKDYLGEYYAINTKDMNMHVMNKFSLSRIIDEVDYE